MLTERGPLNRSYSTSCQPRIMTSRTSRKSSLTTSTSSRKTTPSVWRRSRRRFRLEASSTATECFQSRANAPDTCSIGRTSRTVTICRNPQNLARQKRWTPRMRSESETCRPRSTSTGRLARFCNKGRRCGGKKSGTCRRKSRNKSRRQPQNWRRQNSQETLKDATDTNANSGR